MQNYIIMQCAPKGAQIKLLYVAKNIKNCQDYFAMKRTELDIYSYTDFRVFLDERFKELKEENSKFSRRYFIKRLGLSSSSYITRIIDGSKNLSERLLHKMPVVIGLTREESSFFIDLVRYGQAKTTEAKGEALANLRKNKRFIKVHQMELDHFDHMRDPLSITLRQLVTFKNFREDPKWIMKHLPMKASAKQIKDGLDQLRRLGLVSRNREGKIKATHLHVSTGNRLGSVPLRTYHMNMLDLAKDSMELPVNSRYFRGITLAIKNNSYQKILDKYEKFIDEVRAIADEDEDSNVVYHIETAVFPLTKADDNSNEESEAQQIKEASDAS